MARIEKNQRLNQALNKAVTKVMKEYKKDILERGEGDYINQVEDMPDNSSYSMINSLQQGFQVVMYSCTHMTKLNTLQINQNTSCRIILGK